jgi:chromosome segregation ATPase
VVTETANPINPGLDAGTLGGGSRSTLLDRYQEAVERAERLQKENDDLSAFLTTTEESLLVTTQELNDVKAMVDKLSTVKTQVEQQNLDLAARLATAQIARLEAERSLLEATIEWRAMNSKNNDPGSLSKDLSVGQVR